MSVAVLVEMSGPACVRVDYVCVDYVDDAGDARGSHPSCNTHIQNSRPEYAAPGFDRYTAACTPRGTPVVPT